MYLPTCSFGERRQAPATHLRPSGTLKPPGQGVRGRATIGSVDALRPPRSGFGWHASLGDSATQHCSRAPACSPMAPPWRSSIMRAPRRSREDVAQVAVGCSTRLCARCPSSVSTASIAIQRSSSLSKNTSKGSPERQHSSVLGSTPSGTGTASRRARCVSSAPVTRGPPFSSLLSRTPSKSAP